MCSECRRAERAERKRLRHNDGDGVNELYPYDDPDVWCPACNQVGCQRVTGLGPTPIAPKGHIGFWKRLAKRFQKV